MLGMVQPPQVVPNIQPAALQHPQQSAQPIQQSNSQSAPSLPGQFGSQDQTSASQTLNPVRKQQQTQPVIPSSSASGPPNLQSQPLLSHSLQSVQEPKGHLNVQSAPMSLPQSSQVPNMPSLPLHSASQAPSLQLPIPPALQQSIQTSGIPHLPLQPPLPPQPRLTSMPAFPHQHHSQMGSHSGFQHSGAAQLHHSQSMFHPGSRPPPSMGPLFSHGQPPLPSQLPPQSMYQ
ncbi:unnamed protein product [Ilex paraguariensis]|uniref:Uncharacterized protein n=1 Tax=Ilex paraguariensis TaxID=185542 RepID=A0ABC8TEP5_9AQUA